MALPNVGSPGGSTIGIGVQTDWGTPVSRTIWIDCITVAIERHVQGAVLPTLHLSGAADMYPHRSYVGGETVEGTIECFLAYDDGSLYLLGLLLGAIATTGPAGDVYTHTLKTGNPADWQQHGITIERFWGLRNATKDAEVYDSCVVTGGTITIAPDQPVRLSLNIIGRASAGRTTAGAPTYRTPELVMGHHASGLTWTGVLSAQPIRQATIQIESGRERMQEVGSLYTQYPVPRSQPSAVMNVTRDHDSVAVYAAYLAQTTAEAEIVFTGSGDNEITITFDLAKIPHGQYSDPVSSPGATEQTFQLMAYSDGTNSAVVVVAENERATVALN